MPRPSKEKTLAAAGHNPLPMGEAYEPPAVVKKDKVALTCWHAAVAQLQKQGHFQTCDLMVIERYACTFSLTRKYEQLCQESTGIQETKTGYRSLAAELSCFMKSSAELRSLEKALGISVVARIETGLAEQPADEFDTWMRDN